MLWGQRVHRVIYCINLKTYSERPPEMLTTRSLGHLFSVQGIELGGKENQWDSLLKGGSMIKVATITYAKSVDSTNPSRQAIAKSKGNGTASHLVRGLRNGN